MQLTVPRKQSKWGSLKKPGFGKLKNIIDKNLENGNLLHILEVAQHQQLKPLHDEEEAVIDEVLAEIWRNYNDDGNDILDKEEMEKFIYITLIENGVRKYHDIEDLRNDQNFQRCFDEFDDDGSGTISKDELKEFIK